MADAQPEDSAPAPEPEAEPAADGDTRRDFLGRAGGLVMIGGVAASYGSLAAVAGRYMFPEPAHGKVWVYAARLADVEVGQALSFKTPAGASLTIARTQNTGSADDFIALSSVCPHLGCQVHWENHNQRFFCPCHNGVFDPQGRGTGGPPKDAGQSLAKYPLRAESGLLFIEVEAVGNGGAA